MRQARRSFTAGSAAMFEPLEPRQVFADATQTFIAGSTNSAVLGEDVTFTATVTTAGTPTAPLTGFVRFRENGQLLGQVPIDDNGQAVFTTYSLFNGIHNVRAVFIGNADFTRSASGVAGLLVSQGSSQTRTSGLKVGIVETGSGSAVANGQKLQVNYTGYLTDGTKFDSSLNSGRTPFAFTIGQGRVIQGWDEGLLGMQVGETRVLTVPSDLGYGPQGNPPIPGNATLVFIVRLLSMNPPATPRLLATGSNVTPINSGAPTSGQGGTDFGAVARGTSSNPSAILLSSGSDVNFQLTQSPRITITGANPRQFIITQPAPDDQGNGVITVRFTPRGAVGLRHARINVFTNDPANPTFQILLSGVVV